MNILSAIYCETIKVLRSKVFVLAFIFFAVALAMIAFGIEQRSWIVFFDRFLPLAANMGLIVNFFIASWVFGREFMDKTNKDLITKPISRTTVVFSKFIIIVLWSIVFATFLLLFSFVVGLLLGFREFTSALVSKALLKYIITALLFILISTPGAFFASISKGILAPIGILFIIAIAANILNDTVAAAYFPWTIPNLFCEKGHLILPSIAILISTGTAGIIGTFLWWRFAEQE